MLSPAFREEVEESAAAAADTPFLGRGTPPGALPLPGVLALAGKQLSREGAAFRKPALGTKRNALADSPAWEAWH